MWVRIPPAAILFGVFSSMFKFVKNFSRIVFVCATCYRYYIERCKYSFRQFSYVLNLPNRKIGRATGKRTTVLSSARKIKKYFTPFIFTEKIRDLFSNLIDKLLFLANTTECDITLCSYQKNIREKSDRSLCLLYTSPSPRDRTRSRMPSSA